MPMGMNYAPSSVQNYLRKQAEYNSAAQQASPRLRAQGAATARKPRNKTTAQNTAASQRESSPRLRAQGAATTPGRQGQIQYAAKSRPTPTYGKKRSSGSGSGGGDTGSYGGSDYAGTNYATGDSVAPTSTGEVAPTSDVGKVGPTEPARPKKASDESWWNSDADYQVEEAGLSSVLSTALNSLKAKRGSYDQDFVKTLKNLGWDWQGDDQGTLDNFGQGNWDPNNTQGAYGRGRSSLTNDYAGRGMLDSSFFQDAGTDFNTEFKNQFNDLTDQRTSFLRDNGEDTGAGKAAKDEFTVARNRARQNSLGRRDVDYATRYGV